jgi:hypothetical protein
LCFVTGNANTSTPSFDDVDNGATTLTSPPLDLSKMNDPYIRYWYHYSNDLGQKPGLSRWRAELGTGENWNEIASTTDATIGWQQVLVRVKDIMAPTAEMHVRFIAKDSIGSLVEAGVDDFEVLDPVESTGSVSERDNRLGISLKAYPLPLSAEELHLQVLCDEPGQLILSLKDVLGLEHLRVAKSDLQTVHDLVLQVPAAVPNGMYILEALGSKAATSLKLIISR